jgi:hypothetical protein
MTNIIVIMIDTQTHTIQLLLLNIPFYLATDIYLS